MVGYSKKHLQFSPPTLFPAIFDLVVSFNTKPLYHISIDIHLDLVAETFALAQKSIYMTTSVLIVDNDDMTRNILSRALTHELSDTIIHTTENFDLILDLYYKFKIDIIVASTSAFSSNYDVMFSAIRSIKNNPVKIIIMTSSRDKCDLDNLSDIPGTHIIQKSMNLIQLVSLINCFISEIKSPLSTLQLP